ncbi:GDSL-type esterase/lipase family protein [Hyalangium rubrum]|uniref:GDSL-type esterase/lipase family protein n=1 Tax=Hyalangium rubrum TaxID=3103134 RepID=A0ABU5H291_9BACT|nr:GDSL-type esterase/lipase family protein [Hyalangium sp. s54d21]MDY7227505.1 GDSL-type esterase/lipase family protein [Hyalangium sp. s54d21]
MAKSQSHGPALDFKAKSTGWTIVLTAALALGLSLAPLPEVFRPIPSLRKEGELAPRLAELVLPRSLTGKGATAQPVDDVLTAAPPGPPPEETLPAEDEAAEPENEVVTATAPPSDLEGLSTLTRARALSLEALREKMGSQHVDIEPGCRRKGEAGCEESGLAPFFAALNELREDRRTQPVRVVHLGDSLIASDHITDVIRARLQERHGSGGKGLLFIDRPTGAGRTVRAGSASEGWQITRIIDRNYPKDRLGLTGVAFASAGTSSQSARFSVEGSRTAELFFLTQPNGGTVQFSADGKPLQRLLTRFEPAGVAFSRFTLPEGAKTLSLQSQGKVELHGMSLENGQPGIVYDTVGLPGATAEVFLRAQRGAFRAQLRHRRPSLVVLMVGGNEAFYISRNRTTPAEIRATTKELVKAVREAVPDSACLLMAPLDAAVRTMGGELVPRRGSKEVGDILREVASEGGCAFWDALSAMGGEGASIKWLSAGLLNEDLVHPRARGSDLLGHLFDFSLQRAYAKAHQPLLLAEDPPGLIDAATALKGTFARMRALEQEKKDAERLGILQLGASHTASHVFTDAVRGALSKKLGDGGRGFIAAGKPSPRLAMAHVIRELKGEWRVEDAMKQEAQPGEVWGLSGIRAVGAPGASLRLEFCEGCAPAKTPEAKLDLYWLDAPGAGKLEVKVDGEVMPAEEPPATPLTAPTVRIRSFPVTGPAHTLEVTNVGEGPITVLGASLDFEPPGVVYDAVGLPGSTAFTLSHYEPTALDQQLSARKPGLLVYWYGTNEAALPELDAEQLRNDYVALISRMRASTGAECLILGPTDRLVQDASGRWTEAAALGKVLTTLPAVAKEAGCAYWSARAAMGGERSMLRWQRSEPPLGHPDGVHLTQDGYERLAASFMKELLAAYETFKLAPGEQVKAPITTPAPTAHKAEGG